MRFHKQADDHFIIFLDDMNYGQLSYWVPTKTWSYQGRFDRADHLREVANKLDELNEMDYTI